MDQPWRFWRRARRADAELVEEWNSQYGLLKVWRITDQGAFVDGTQISDVTLKALNIDANKYMAVRIGVRENAANVGGINIFGKRFGNYPQDILMRLRFRS